MINLRESIYYSPCNDSNGCGSLEVESSSNTVSEYVHNLANGIYKEFESLILHHGENVVKNLMPMVVSCLETLDRVYCEKHNIEVEFELLKEDSSQLMTQYEREKNQRKNAEENLFKSEDGFTEACKKFEDEIHRLKSIQKMHEIRLKNSQEQVTRLEKKEVERQFEYDKLLSRHHEFLRIHRDYLEKARNHQSESSKAESNSNKIKVFSNEIKQNNTSEILTFGDNKSTENVHITNLSEELGQHSDFHGNLPSFHPYEWDFPSNRSDDENSNSEEISVGANILPLGDELAGMSHEIESIIKENNDLIATKNALNIVKDDLISKLDEANSEIEILQHENNSLNTMKTSLKLRINNLEIENKGLKQEVSFWQHKIENDKDEESIPMSQRKRFTRLEMARVLMERNQYKEKVLEMEEYVKWMKVLKNKKEKKLSIWERFSRLFKSNTHSTNSEVKVEDLTLRANSFSINDSKNRNSDLVSNCLALKDPGRQQVNGWSLPSDMTLSERSSLPFPIYCRPLLENQHGLKIICAVAVNLSKGSNLNGDTFIGSSIFYNSQNIKIPENPNFMKIEEKINQVFYIKEFGKLTNEDFETMKFKCESHVWICTSNDNQSQIIIVDANRPSEYLDSFIISTSPVQCLGSVPGANANDYIKKPVQISLDFKMPPQMDLNLGRSNNILPNFRITEVDCIPYKSYNVNYPNDNNFQLSDVTITRNFDLSTKIHPFESEQFDTANFSKKELFEQNSLQPTVWIGCRNGDLFVHPATGNRSHCLHHVRLSDSITNIVHQNSRVFVSLANGSMVIFSRYLSNENHNQMFIGQWQMSKYHFLEPDSNNHSIRCLETVPLTNKVWIGFKNQIIVIDDATIALSTSFEAHPRSDYAVRQMCCAGDGVWISLRLDTTLRLFNIYNYQHLQDLNVEPHINKLIEPSLLGLSLLRITCLSISCHRLWIGTNKGIIISAPFLNDVSYKKDSTQVEFVNDLLGDSIKGSVEEKDNFCSPTFIPHINPEDLQLSYHGHRDAVKFFITVRYRNQDNSIENIEKLSEENSESKPKKSVFLIMSGGEGYKDFRISENMRNLNPKCTNSKLDVKSDDFIKNNSHLIVWQLTGKHA